MLAGKVTIADVELAAGLVATRTSGGAEGEPLASLEEPSVPLEEASQERSLRPHVKTPAPEQSVPARAPAAALAILALKPGGCHWPVNDPRHATFRFCNSPTTEPPYCDEHRRAAYLAPAPVGGPSRFGYRLPAARQVRTVMRAPTPVCTQSPNLGTTSSQKPRFTGASC